MKFKLDVWTKHMGKDDKYFPRLYHEEFSEEEIIEMLSEKLKEKYDSLYEVEIAEIISR